MRAIFSDDLVTSIADGSAVGVEIPLALEGLSTDEIRIINGTPTDVRSRTSWFIDDKGRKRISQLDPSWLSVTCSLNTPTVFNEGVWSLKSTTQSNKEFLTLTEDQLDLIADSVYTRSPSRVARYERKRDQAMAYKEAGYPTPIDAAIYNYIAGEAIERSISEQTMADLILARSNLFTNFGSDIEVLRAKAKNDIEATSNDAGRKSAMDAIIVSAETLKTTLLGAI